MPETRRVHEGLDELLRAVIVRSPMEYELAGRTHKVAAFGAGQSPVWSAYSAGQPPLVVDLTDRHLRRGLLPPARLARRAADQRREHRRAAVRPRTPAATAGRAGWSLAQTMPTATSWRARESWRTSSPPGEFAAAHGGAPSPGAPLHVLFARESRTQQPGFYVANGETAAPFGSESRMTRIYWHVSEEGAVPLTAAVTSSLNRYQVPFRFKTLAYSGVYTRADAAVLYFASRHYQVVARLLPAMRAAVRGWLRAATPLLTLRLDDGIGLAEDPATGESFGMSRSRFIAQADLGRLCARHAEPEEARMMELAIQFDAWGCRSTGRTCAPGAPTSTRVPRDRPPGTRRRRLAGTVPRRRRGRSALALPRRDMGRRSLQLAGRLDGAPCRRVEGGAQVLRRRPLFRHQRHRPVPLPAPSTRPDALIAQTARGALGQALSRADEVPTQMRHALYSGWLGHRARAARRRRGCSANRLCSREALRLVDGQRGHDLDPMSLDVIGGAAGAVLALAAIDGRLGGDRYLDEARRLGDHLLAHARRGDEGWSWTTDAAAGAGAEGPRGYSHGAGGIAVALLELSRRTGDSRYLEGALGGLRLRAPDGSPPSSRTGPTSARSPRPARSSSATHWPGATARPASASRACARSS